jgi:hypothetical protein
VQVPKIVLSAVGVGVLCLVGLLLIEINSSPASAVPEDELARARAAHARLQAGSGSAAVRPREIEPSARPEVRQRDDEPAEPERPADPSPAPTLSPTFVDRSAPRPQVTIAGRDQKKSVEVRMDKVNGAYDRGNYLDAHEAALEVLEDQPRNVRMLRVAVSTSCILGEVDRASELYERLPPGDQADMAKRCGEQYGIQLGEQ